MAQLHVDLQSSSPILRYGFSVVCVGVALGLSLVFESLGLRGVYASPFNLAIGLVSWYAGLGPSAVSVALSAASFSYFFVPRLYSFEILSKDILPRLLIFTAWALIIAGFVTVRRRIETELRHTSDNLRDELQRSQHKQNEISWLNRELATQAEQLEASNKELESFAYSVSHDLRAPLRHVVGYSELLQRQAGSPLDDKGRRYIETIVEAAKRMSNLIDDLLAFSRIGRTESTRTPMSLDDLVKDVVNEIRQEASGRDIAWKIGTLPICYGDRSMLRLAIANLVANAVKFTSMRAQAEIEIGCVDKNNAKVVEIYIKDNGAGFDMQYAHKLFGVFQRLHLPEEFEGTGIGLAIVQRIIHRHGGKVRAEGAVGRGATFYFSLPGAQEAVAKTASRP
jgi:signal transduction histidine kinase